MDGQPEPAAALIAEEAIKQTWPMASGQSIARLVSSASVFKTARGPIMSEEESPSRIALVLRGTVAATWSAPDGRTVYAGLYGPRQLMGVATLSGGPMTVGIEALTESAVIMWRSDAFRRVLDTDSALALDLLDRAIYAIQALNRLNKLGSFTTAASRLAGLLLQHGRLTSTEQPIVARRHLPALAGVTREMANRILREWESNAVVRRVGGSGLEVLDRAALEAVAAPLADFPLPDPPIPGAWLDPLPED